MSTLKNKVQLIGNVGNTPEVVEFENNKKLVKFSLATNETFKNKEGEKVTETDWHNVVAWGKTAELIEKIVSKGQLIALEGKLKTRSYETENGEKRYATEVVANEFVILSKKEDETSSSEEE